MLVELARIEDDELREQVVEAQVYGGLLDTGGSPSDSMLLQFTLICGGLLQNQRSGEIVAAVLFLMITAMLFFTLYMELSSSRPDVLLVSVWSLSILLTSATAVLALVPVSWWANVRPVSAVQAAAGISFFVLAATFLGIDLLTGSWSLAGNGNFDPVGFSILTVAVAACLGTGILFVTPWRILGTMGRQG